jgi:hypothetical protein
MTHHNHEPLGSSPGLLSSDDSPDYLPEDGFPTPTPPIKISELRSLSVEPATVNGLPLSVNVVAKNHPFIVALAGDEGVFLGDGAWVVSASLFFDGPDTDALLPVQLNREVLTTKAFTAKKGKVLELECRVFVLSSHHHESFFRIKVQAQQQGMQGEPFLVGHTDPIRVVSKPSQVRNKDAKRRRNGPTDTAKKQTGTAGMANALAAQNERLERIEKQNELILSSLLHQSDAVPDLPLNETAKQEPNVAAINRISPAARFESLFTECLAAFRELPEEERPHKVRRTLEQNDVSGEFSLACAAHASFQPVPAPLFSAESTVPSTLSTLPSTLSTLTPFPPSSLGMAALGSSNGFSSELSDDLVRMFSTEDVIHIPT